jgi:hypothetical protein
MTVYVEKDGPVTTIIFSRPEVRNAVESFLNIMMALVRGLQQA